MSNTTLLGSLSNQLKTIASSKPVFGTEIINHLGGVAAFEITSDMISLGIKLNKINGFKNDTDTTELFNRNKYSIMGTMQEVAKDAGIEPITYLFELCHIHRYSHTLVTECYNILCDDSLAAKTNEHTMKSVDAAAHQITLAVVTAILETYHKNEGRYW